MLTITNTTVMGEGVGRFHSGRGGVPTPNLDAHLLQPRLTAAPAPRAPVAPHTTA
jgi:hypothetical protein